MKIRTIIYLSILVILASCTKVIDVDLNEADPKIVVDAYIQDYEDVNSIQKVFVKLSRSSSVFEDNTIDVIENQTIYAINESGNRFKLDWHADSALQNYSAIINNADKSTNWSIETTIEGIDITAETSIPNFVGLDSIVATKLPFGPPKEGLSVICFFNDIAGEANNYRFRIFVNGTNMGGLYITRDDAFDGEQIAYPFMHTEVQIGDTVRVDLLSIDEFSLDYYKVFAMTNGGGGFSAAPGNPISNIKGEDAIGIFTGQTISSVTRIID
ncbi:MAG: DUF4249 domain-containing protein [Bacteroidales bacterium]|nr:DUF4249 domain-containing protein [Bacteroidales bacterium]